MDGSARFARVDELFRRASCQGPVLELGCGDGRVLAMIRRAGHAVVGIDIDRPALDRARARDLTALVHGDAERLPFANEAFGTVLSGYFSANMMNRDRMVAEAARVLRPGGVLAYTMLNPLARAVDLFQVELRRHRRPRLSRVRRSWAQLSDPFAEAERLRACGLVPLPLKGPAYLPVLRRFPAAMRHAPMLTDGWTRLSWEVVVAGVRPGGPTDARAPW